MYPIVNIFGRTFTSYALLSLVGAVISGCLAVWMTGRKKLNPDITIMALLLSIPGILLGGMLAFGITNMELLMNGLKTVDDFRGFITLLTQVFGGSVFYGGLFGGIGTAALYLKIKKQPLHDYSNVIAPFVALFHGFGRLGCFLVGCCYGIESELGFTFTHALIHSANHVNRFPVQLLEAGFEFILAGVLFLLLKKDKLQGRLFLVYLMSYSVLRFSLEFLRGDVYRGIWWLGLSTSQWISLFLFPISLLLFLKQGRKQKSKNSVSEGGVNCIY